MRRTATESQKCRIETDQITIRLGTGSRHKRHSSLRSIRLLENVALQAEILRIAIKSAPADRNDLSLFVGHWSSRRSTELVALFLFPGEFTKLSPGLLRYLLI